MCPRKADYRLCCRWKTIRFNLKIIFLHRIIVKFSLKQKMMIIKVKIFCLFEKILNYWSTITFFVQRQSKKLWAKNLFFFYFRKKLNNSKTVLYFYLNFKLSTYFRYILIQRVFSALYRYTYVTCRRSIII